MPAGARTPERDNNNNNINNENNPDDSQGKQKENTKSKKKKEAMQAIPNFGGPMPTANLEPSSAAAVPLISADTGDLAEFDYSAFLQQQQQQEELVDMGYLAEEGSASMPTPPLPASATSAPPSSTAVSQGPRLRQILPFHHHNNPQQQQQQQQQQLPASTVLTIHGGGGGRAGAMVGHGSNAGSAGAVGQPKQKLERRGHTKSRRGCFNCKRRRIKVSCSFFFFFFPFFLSFSFLCWGIMGERGKGQTEIRG